MKLYEIKSKKEFSFSCIYMWENLNNGKKYIGQASNFYNRMSQYKQGFFNDYMKKSIAKHGLENFEITILEKDILIEDLDVLEQYWMDFYQTYKRENGYNICEYASTTRGTKRTPEQIEKFRKRMIDYFSVEENRLKCSGENNHMYGKVHDEKWRKQHSEFMKRAWKENEELAKLWSRDMNGSKNVMYGVHLNGELNPMYGKKHSEETRKKISEAVKGVRYKIRKVKHLETGIIYNNIKDANKKTGLSQKLISRCCNGKIDTTPIGKFEFI